MTPWDIIGWALIACALYAVGSVAGSKLGRRVSFARARRECRDVPLEAGQVWRNLNGEGFLVAWAKPELVKIRTGPGWMGKSWSESPEAFASRRLVLTGMRASL